jgi:hypothetical protein
MHVDGRIGRHLQPAGRDEFRKDPRTVGHELLERAASEGAR